VKRLAILFALACVAAGTSAHHSGAMFDRSKSVALEGTVIEYKFVAPHSWISVMATANGNGARTRWDVEGATASRMKAQGVTPANLKVGDRVKILAHPLRDGRKGASLVELTLADGTRMINDTTKLEVGR
jgi:hypothetical protein